MERRGRVREVANRILASLRQSFRSQSQPNGRVQNGLDEENDDKDDATTTRTRDIRQFLGTTTSPYHRFQETGEMRDLEYALSDINETILGMPDGDSDLPIQFGMLARMLVERYQCLGELVDLDKAIVYQSQLVLVTPQSHLAMPTHLNNLGCSLGMRFKRLGELADLDKAIDSIKRAISVASPTYSDVPGWSNNLGCLLLNRFERLGELVDMNKGIEYLIQAVLFTPHGHEDRPGRLSNLGGGLHSRFVRLDENADLEKATDYTRQAVLLTPQGHRDLHGRLNNLSAVLVARFRRLGELADLDEAIERLNQAILLAPRGHPDMHLQLNNLSSSLETRYVRLGELADLDKAITTLRKAVSLIPLEHADMPRLLSNLGAGLDQRFKCSDELSDIDQAIESHSQAISLISQGHPHRPRRLNKLGSSLESRFKHTGNSEDLNKAISYINQAVSLTPEGHSELPTWLNNLGYSLQNRFRHLGKLADLDKAIECTSQAVSLTPQGHSDMPERLENLGLAYHNRSIISSGIEDVDRSLDCFQKAAQSLAGSPSHRLRSALKWARISNKHGTPSLLIAYGQVMSILPQLVWLGSPVDSRYRHLAELGGVSSEAAAAAITRKEYKLALEWLEEGRLIVWKQMLKLRTPIEELSAVAPALSEEFKQVAHDLDFASSPKPMHDAGSSDASSLEQSAQKHRRLAERWEELLNQIRNIPDFNTFLRPQKSSELMRSAQYGPVVLINIHDSRSDALVIQPGVAEISHIPLTFSYEKATDFHRQLVSYARSGDLTDRGFQKLKREPKDIFVKTLAALWSGIVKPVLDHLNYKPQASSSIGDPPHITWCTTGPLSFLPLHAAGDYESGLMIFDYVVSSYTPTLSTLIAPALTPNVFSGLLAVGQQLTPGLPPLPGTVAELDSIQERTYGTATRLDEGLATPAAVLAGMEQHSWVHLACHATQNPTNPLESAFYLHGGTLSLAAITRNQLKNPELAFLSACQTAKGDESLSEEAVHLAAGMLMAGYRTVIATMWSIGDEDAPLVSEKVYEHLFKGGKPDARRAAMAVHKATACLRAKVGVEAYAKWVPYIHIGL